jgi:hypothetical protein
MEERYMENSGVEGGGGREDTTGEGGTGTVALEESYQDDGYEYEGYDESGYDDGSGYDPATGLPLAGGDGNKGRQKRFFFFSAASVADPECLFRLGSEFFPSRIPNSGSKMIQNVHPGS